MSEQTTTYDPTCDYGTACCHYDQRPRCLGTAQAADPISQWIAGIVQGLASFEDHEWAVREVCADHAAMAYVLRCLANPGCAGAGDVLDAIVAKRDERLAARGTVPA
jgi:hypothetical protein